MIIESIVVVMVVVVSRRAVSLPHLVRRSRSTARYIDTPAAAATDVRRWNITAARRQGPIPPQRCDTDQRTALAEAVLRR